MKILTESEKKQILLEREQAIINSFAKTFNSIKRLDENEMNPHDIESRSVETGINPYSQEDNGDIGNSLEDYARIMNKTADYPWTRNAGNKEEAERMEQANNSAKRNFEELFYRTFTKEATKIITNNGPYSFHGIKFNANYTNYSLIFKDNTSIGNYLWLKPEKNGYYIDSQNIKIADKASDDLLNKMLDYNSVRNKVK